MKHFNKMKLIRYFIPIISLLGFTYTVRAQILQQDATFTAGTDFVDGAVYTDSGGPLGDYSNDELSTLNLCAEPGGTITITFTEFEVEASGGSGGQCWDNLTVAGDTGGGDATYAGDTFDLGGGLVCTDATDAAGDPTLGPFTSAVGGCIVMTFDSDGSVPQAGWVANIGVVSPPQEIIQQEATLTAGTDFFDGDIYTDSGGSGANYSNNELSTLNLCANPSETVTITFTDFEVEASGGSGGQCWDNLTVSGDTGGGDATYAGDTFDLGGGLVCTDATDAAGNPTLGPFTSAVGGCLTMVFDSDGSVTQSGWQAAISVNAITCLPPVAVCTDFTVNLDAAGTGSITAANIDGGSSAECGGLTLSIEPGDPTSFSCADIGSPATVTLVAEDLNTDQATCDATITVADNIPPVALCQDFTINLDNNGSGSLTEADINNGSSDNCTAAGNLTFNILGPSTYNCNLVGTNGVILQVTDESGNTGTCTAAITIQDLMPAEIECRQPVSTIASPGSCIRENFTVLEPFANYDNCGADNVSFTRLPAGNDFPVGETVLNWTATDANGNISTCQSIVYVEDTEFPTINSCNSAIDFLDPGSCTAQVMVNAVGVSDNCGIASITGTGLITLPIGVHSNPITVTDVNGNVTVHDFTIFVHDGLDPVFQNCPEETVNLTAGADGTADYPAQTPVATDNCGVPSISSDLPEDGLPLGSSVVTFVATDDYGNTSECIVNVEVTGSIFMHPVSDISSSLGENESTQTVSWNALNALTQCDLCEETSLEGFRFVGTWWGHQYFLADENSLTREEANLIAENYDGHLAVINNADENAYLVDALNEEIRSVWIGLMPTLEDGEWTLAWDNGEEFDFNAADFEEVNAGTRVILGNDGIWKVATDTEEKYYLIERPCVNFEQVGPIYSPENEEEPDVLLRSGDIWPQGEYEVTYSLTDMCGNTSLMTFDVNVLPEVSEYCNSAGVDNSVWIETFTFHELTNASEDNEGYADYTAETTTMNIGDGVILVGLEAGGNEAEEMLYWNIYLDANADGDFFDADEMLYQAASREDITANISLPLVSVENARLRVMVSRYGFAAPCGDTYIGEIEDYNLNLLLPEDYAREFCEVAIASLQGERNGFTVDLDWTVNSVCQVEMFTIEYSSDGVDFNTLTEINQIEISDLFYNEVHTLTLPSVPGTAVYRVKVQTADYPAFYTNPVTFYLNGKPNVPILHPNPADSYVRVALGDYTGQRGQVVIYDNLGEVRLVQKFDEDTGEAMMLNLQKFVDGIYHVSVQTEGRRVQTQRLVINKLHGWRPAK